MKKSLGILLAVLCLCSCEGIDCVLNNVVSCYYTFYSSETGNNISLIDTLTITAQGTDSILFNRGVNTSSVALPMSYDNDTDTLSFIVYGEDYYNVSTLYVSKTNVQHFESPDCPTSMFHFITDVTFDSNVIDSVVVIKADVNYMQDENIKVYFRTSD